MKNVYLCVLMLLSVTVNAHADDSVIARVVTTEGIPVPGPRCRSFELNVFNSGRVVTSECGANEKELLQFDKFIVQNMAAAAERLTDAPLKVEDPQAPACADAAGIRYRVMKKGKEIEIGGVEACRRLVPDATPSPTATRFLKVLEGFKNLAFYDR